MALIDFSYETHIQPHVYFSGRVCHDLNNIITTAMGAVSLLQFKAPLESTFRGELDRLDQSIDGLSQFTKRLERVFLDSFENRMPYDLDHLIRSVVEDCKTPSLSLSYEGESVEMASIDTAAVKACLVELVTNAGEAMGSKGRVEIRLKRVYSDNQNACQISVSDRGRGIPEDQLSEVFVPFRSLHKRGNLVGLGLVLAGSVVHHHDWSLVIDSEIDRGTTVTIHIPLFG